VQLSIYYTREDEYLIKKIKAEAKTQRKSNSAVILSILEKHFERERKMGEILRDIGSFSEEQFTKALDIQKKEKKRRLLGEILDEGFIEIRKIIEIMDFYSGGDEPYLDMWASKDRATQSCNRPG